MCVCVCLDVCVCVCVGVDKGDKVMLLQMCARVWVMYSAEKRI